MQVLNQLLHIRLITTALLLLLLVCGPTCTALPCPVLQGTAGPLKDTSLAAAFARSPRGTHAATRPPLAPFISLHTPASNSVSQLNLFRCHLRPFATAWPGINHTPSSPDLRRPSEAQTAPKAPPALWSTIQLQPQEQFGFPARLLTACGCGLITRTSTLSSARARPGSRFEPASRCLSARHLHVLALLAATVALRHGNPQNHHLPKLMRPPRHTDKYT